MAHFYREIYKIITNLLRAKFAAILILIIILSSNIIISQEKPKKHISVPTSNPSKYLEKSSAYSGSKSGDGTIIDNKQKKGSAFDSLKAKPDSVKKENRIVSIEEDGEVLVVKLELEDYEHEIKISIYNMLGKKVVDVYKGMPVKELLYPYEFSYANLPNGVFICMLNVKDHTKTKKFIVSR